jgi:hypothetical protein
VRWSAAAGAVALLVFARATLGAAAAPPPAPGGWAPLRFGPTDVSGEPGPQSEVSVAVDPADPSVLVAAANDLTHPGVAAWSTRDGGRTWTRRELPLRTAPPVEEGASGTDPSAAAGPDGTLYVGYVLVNGDGSAASVVVAASRDGGRSWGSPSVVTPGLQSGVYNDKDMIAVDDGQDPHRGYVYAVWDQDEPAGKTPSQAVMLAWSPPGGARWSAPVVLNAGFGSGEGMYADLAVLPDGSLYVVWDDYGQSDEMSVLVGRRCVWAGPRLDCLRPVVVARSFINLNGPGPARGARVDCESEGLSQPGPPNLGWSCYAIPAAPARGIAADPSVCAAPDGTLHVAYDTATSPGAYNAEVMVTGSGDQGATWTTPVEVDGDLGRAYDFFPWIACDPVTGALAVSFYSTRGDPSGRLVQEDLTWSLDGGTTWTPPAQVSRLASDEAVPSADNNDYGDYEGLALWDDVAYAGWTGSAGAPGLQEQVFVAGAEPPTPPGAPASATLSPAGPGAMAVRWTAVPGATSYDVLLLPGSAGLVPDLGHLGPAPWSPGALLLAAGVRGTSWRLPWLGAGPPAVAVAAVDPAGVGPATRAVPVVSPAPSPHTPGSSGG